MTLQIMRDICQHQLYMSISDGVSVGNSTPSCGIPRGIAIVAAAAVCRTVKCVLAQFCPSQLQGSFGSHGNQAQAPKSLVRYYPNTLLLMSRPPALLAASVKSQFQGKGTVDCSQKSASQGSSLTIAVSITSILSKVYKGLSAKYNSVRKPYANL